MSIRRFPSTSAGARWLLISSVVAPLGCGAPESGTSEAAGSSSGADAGAPEDAATGEVSSADAGATREAESSVPEVCANGLDDNGDGHVDEGCACTLGQSQACYTGPAGTRGIGACRDGTQGCAGSAEFSSWGACEGALKIPSHEDCSNGVDDDCDGKTDCFDSDCPACPNCKAIKTAAPELPDGTYTIDPDGSGANPPLSVVCDMTRDTGGWTLVMRGWGTYTDGATWNTDLGKDPQDATVPDTTFAFSNATILAIRGSGGVYRLVDENHVVAARFVGPSCLYTHTKPASENNCNVTYADLGLTQDARTGNDDICGGISDYSMGNFCTHDLYPGHIWWIGGTGHAYQGGRFTMWVR